MVTAANQRTNPEPVALSARPELPSAARPRPPAARTRTAPPTLPQASGTLARYRGSLAINSDPPGARVLLNGQVVGSTPLLLRDLPAGSCVVRIEAEGYETWSTAARIVADQRARVSATLQRGVEEPR
jgi:hypothetical protein